MASITYSPIPIFELGPLSLSLHGVFAALGFLAGAALALREAKRRGFDVDVLASALTWALIGAILGARLFTVPAHWTEPGFGLSDVVSPAGSYSIIGGMAGGILAGIVRFRMLGARILPYLDFAAPGLAIGTVVGRIGDLAIVEHLGSETSFFLGYAVKPGYDLAPQHDALECAVGEICGIYHHTALYDLFGAAVLLGVLLVVRRSWSALRYGQLFALWLTWYGVQRFLIDFTRLDAVNADATIGPVTWSQLSGLLLGALGLGLYLVWRRGRVVDELGDEAMGAIVVEPQEEPAP